MKAQKRLFVGTFDRAKLERFRRAIDGALKLQQDRFRFEGRDYLVDFAAHFAAHIESRLGKDD